MTTVLLLSALCIACVSLGSAETYPQDTYLNALQTSQSQDVDNINGYEYLQPSNNKYLPPTPVYGPPAPVYGPPAPIYGPPPSFYKPVPVSYEPRDDWFWNKLKAKINLFTIGKIILKLLIFKKIIKFIGVIFLLLVLPKLKDLFKDHMTMDEDTLMDSKELKTDRDILTERIEELTKFAIKAFATYREK